MRLLYIGHYKENSGWSKAAIDLISAINTTDIDIVCRDIKLTDTKPSVPQEILDLEKKSLENIDVCIQHVLPHHLVGSSKFKKNIAYYVGESDSILYNPWIDSLKAMDEIWVPNNTAVNNMIQDGFDNVKFVPHAFNLSKYSNKSTKTINFNQDNYKYKFYYIADLNDRKNIESVIRCFHSEFASHEPVSLVLKVKKYGIHEDDLQKHMINVCTKIKENMRIYKNIEDYHKEIIIAGNTDDEFIQVLHNSCNCLINTTHGEGWSIPAFEAMCYGNTPICCNEGGPKEFIDFSDKNTGTLINGVMTVCNHNDPAFPNIFTGREHWFTPDEKEIKKAMRFYYDNDKNIDRSAGLKHAEKFSYENVGMVIKELLNV